MSFLGDSTPSKSNVKCDLPSCNVDDNSEEWSILPGCWHSFHNICLANLTHCPLCTEIIKQEIKELGEVAKAAILHSTTAPIENPAENDIPDEDEIDGTSPIIPCADSNAMSATLHATNAKISSFSPPQPQYNHDMPDISQNPTQPLPNMSKPPDCKSCSHPDHPNMKHHISQEPNTLPCPLHNKQPSIRRPKCSPPADNTKQNLPSFQVIKNTYPGDVTEWLLPSSLSQSQILGPTDVGSNACTVISVLGAIKLGSNMTFPSTTTELSKVINTFSSSMKEGSQLYNMFNTSSHQPNLEVKDVVAKLKTLNVDLHLTEDTGFFSVQDFLDKLQSLSYSAQQATGVLIVAPDKAMLIFMKDGRFGVMDSHQHGEHGGLLAVCCAGRVSDFVAYLSAMVHRYWNASLCGSNFTILET